MSDPKPPTERLDDESRSQPPTVAKDGKITCPRCSASWYDCTHLKLAAPVPPEEPPAELKEALEDYDRIRSEEPVYSDYSNVTFEAHDHLHHAWEANLVAARAALVALYDRQQEERKNAVEEMGVAMAENVLLGEKVASLESQLESLNEWKSSVLSSLESKPDFVAGKWAGDKRGWGYVFEYINWTHRELERLKAEQPELKKLLDVMERYDTTGNELIAVRISIEKLFEQRTFTAEEARWMLGQEILIPARYQKREAFELATGIDAKLQSLSHSEQPIRSEDNQDQEPLGENREGAASPLVNSKSHGPASKPLLE